MIHLGGFGGSAPARVARDKISNPEHDENLSLNIKTK